MYAIGMAGDDAQHDTGRVRDKSATSSRAWIRRAVGEHIAEERRDGLAQVRA